MIARPDRQVESRLIQNQGAFADRSPAPPPGSGQFLDLRGFSDAYRSYDIVARAWPAWGLIYPFVELALGVAYLLNLAPIETNVLTLVVMVVSAVGVLKALLDK